MRVGSGNSSKISSNHRCQSGSEESEANDTCFARLGGGASSEAAGVKAGAKMFQRWPVSNVAAE
eukprot:9638021-Prorocentrum_lima.AAC.1